MNVFSFWANASDSCGGWKERVSREMGLQPLRATPPFTPLSWPPHPKVTISHTSPTAIMDTREGGACGLHAEGETWSDLSFICRCFPGKREGRLLLSKGGPDSLITGKRQEQTARGKETSQETGLPGFTWALTSLERTILCASFLTSLKRGQSCLLGLLKNLKQYM